MAEGSVKHLDVEALKETGSEFKEKIKDFEKCVDEMWKITNGLTETWEGLGSTKFQNKYLLMAGALKDISDILYDVYKALLDAQVGYLDADEAIAKEISIDGTHTRNTEGGPARPIPSSNATSND